MNDCRSDVSPVNIIISDDSHPYSEEAENNYSELEIASTGIRDKSSSIGAYSIRGENEQCHQRARYMTDISTEHDNETIRETGRVVKFIAERSRILFISVIIILLIVVIILTVVLCTKDKETHYKGISYLFFVVMLRFAMDGISHLGYLEHEDLWNISKWTVIRCIRLRYHISSLNFGKEQ